MKLIAVTDNSHSVPELAKKICAIHHCVDYIHLREKSKAACDVLSLIKILILNGVEKEKIVIHDRLDIALLTALPNIHLPSHSLPVKEVRKNFPHLRIGCSVHSLTEAKQAEADGADYVLYGHCFETNCKTGLKPNGIATLLDIKKQIQLPVFAIGGITLDRVQMLNEMKMDGVAVMSGIFSSPMFEETACMYQKKCKENNSGN